MDNTFSIQANLDWSEWVPIHPPDDLKEIPRQHGGIYRVTHVDSGGIEYVGRSYSNLRYRIQKIDHRTTLGEQPDGSSHIAAPHLWQLKQTMGPGLLVSWIGIGSDDIDEIDGIWAAYLANYRATVGRSPAANFGQTIRIQGDLPSDEQTASTPFADLRSYKSRERDPLNRGKWKDVTGQNWMGLNWSKPFDLSLPDDYSNWSNRLPEGSGVYRTWKPGSDVLDRIDATSNISRRIRSQADEIGYESKISFCELDITGKPSKTELEVDLAGAHYIATNIIPESEIGGLDSISDKAKNVLDRLEDNVVEFKNADFNNTSLAEEMVALANGGGGEIFIGVDDNGDTKALSNLDAIEQRVANISENSINPSLRLDVKKPEIDGDQILWVRIDGAHNRLYSTNGAFLIRSGSTKRSCQWADFEKFLQENPHIVSKIINSEGFDLSELAYLQNMDRQ